MCACEVGSATNLNFTNVQRCTEIRLPEEVQDVLLLGRRVYEDMDIDHDIRVHNRICMDESNVQSQSSRELAPALKPPIPSNVCATAAPSMTIEAVVAHTPNK